MTIQGFYCNLTPTKAIHLSITSNLQEGLKLFSPQRLDS